MSLQHRWNELCAATIGTGRFWTLAVDHRAAYHALAPMIASHCRGVVLDAGAGRLAWRKLLSDGVTRYLSTDYAANHPDLSFVCDLTKNIPLADDSVDTVFCCSVLEHVEDPFLAVAEIARVLRPGGALILSVPFRYYVHGAPVDYFRFTRYGMEMMAQRAGLSVERAESNGGLVHELSHAISMVVAAAAGPGRMGTRLSSAASWVLWRFARLVDGLDRSGRFAQNVNAVLRK